jgi:hypothetical protein
MKPYEKPEANIVVFQSQDVLTLSEENDNIGGAIWE